MPPNEQEVYWLAARYTTQQAAGRAYTPLQQIIHDEDCDLSAYRFLRPLEKKWYVAIIGERPAEKLHQRIETILYSLTRGQRVSLDDATLLWLLERRLEQI